LSVSTCAESSPTEKFLILQNRNRPTVKFYFYPVGATVKFYFLRKSDAHLYRLVRELTPGNGSIERHTHPTTTFRALSGGGQSGLRLAFLETTFNFHDQGILQVERLAASVQRHTSLNRVGLNSV
jgi:hypothetical protein